MFGGHGYVVRMGAMCAQRRLPDIGPNDCSWQPCGRRWRLQLRAHRAGTLVMGCTRNCHHNASNAIIMQAIAIIAGAALPRHPAGTCTVMTRVTCAAPCPWHMHACTHER